MNKANYFFERAEFKNVEIKKPFYLYKGYRIETKNGPYHPVVLHFGKDEIVISYKDTDGRIDPVFSLYVADGELNQKMLTKKIEGYWKMPLWPLNKELPLEVDKTLLSISYFSSMYEFDVKDDEFVKCRLFKRKKKRDDFKLSEDTADFIYLTQKDKKYLSERDRKETKWAIIDKEIHACHINFRKILLDFLYELEYSNTFEDENFFKLQAALQNNKLLDALSRKCRYLDELYKLRDYKRTTSEKKLPKKFRDAEKSWLNVCFVEAYREIFVCADCIFETLEEEAELVLFRSCIGVSKRSRTKHFTKDDHSLRNQSATFFLRQYSLYNAFKTLLHPATLAVLLLLLPLIPLGDFFLSEYGDFFFSENKINSVIGISSIVLPVLMLAFLVLYYKIAQINLFKLLLPRLFLGIMLGWSIFWSTEDLWKTALIADARTIIVTNIVLMIIIFLYIFTDIRNKIIRVKEWPIIKRTALLLFFAMLISFVQGFYVLQLQAKPMLESSGILSKDNLQLFPYDLSEKEKREGKREKKEEIKQMILKEVKKSKVQNSEEIEISGITVKKDIDINESKIEILKDQNREMFGIKNYISPKLFNNEKNKIYYIWSIHLSQLVMSILIGIVFQLLWEDRSITEPL